MVNLPRVFVFLTTIRYFEKCFWALYENSRISSFEDSAARFKDFFPVFPYKERKKTRRAGHTKLSLQGTSQADSGRFLRKGVDIGAVMCYNAFCITRHALNFRRSYGRRHRRGHLSDEYRNTRIGRLSHTARYGYAFFCFLSKEAAACRVIYI